MTSTSGDRHTPSVEVAARFGFGPEQSNAIRATVARECNDAEFVMLLELAARYQLDPFARHIWAAKFQGPSGPASIVVGRDGYLAIAEKYDDYRGMDGDVVRKNDTFKKSTGPDGPVIVHEYGEHADGRGRVIGAWAIVYRNGHRPSYFYAPIEDYKPSGRKLEVSPWSRQESVMMLKCAQSTALRLAFNISGFVPAEEAGLSSASDVPLNGGGDITGAATEDPDSFDWGEDEKLAERLKRLIETANETRQGAFRPAKVRALLRDKTHHERLLLAAEIEEFIRARGGEVPVEEEEIPDAEIVPEHHPEDDKITL